MCPVFWINIVSVYKYAVSYLEKIISTLLSLHLTILNKNILHIHFKRISQAPIAQLVARKAFNPGVSVRISVLPTFFQTLDKSQSVVFHLLHQWAYILKKKQPVAWKDCCVKYLHEKARNHMHRGTGCCDMTEIVENGIKPQSINQMDTM